MDLQMKKYLRGQSVRLQGIKDKKLKGQLAVKEELYGQSAKTAAKVEQWLLPSEGGYLEAEGLEKTYNFRQENIVREVDLLSSSKAFDIKLPEFGSYSVDYTSSGRNMLIGGRKGHLAIVNWQEARLVMELQVRETVRDVKFLHNELFFAAAQKKLVYQRDGMPTVGWLYLPTRGPRFNPQHYCGLTSFMGAALHTRSMLRRSRMTLMLYEDVCCMTCTTNIDCGAGSYAI